MNQHHRGWHNWLLVLGVVVLSATPLFFIRDSEFGGADGEAETAITEVHPQYEPWFEPIVELPGGETESMLFALQAALGAGVIGFAIGLYRGRTERRGTERASGDTVVEGLPDRT
ncbi:MAG: energy-coupling factor ABC transporter substrate-binding protein [Cyanobacteria bacterium SID2]|nr:energy-coupling factor ABC transporter substrate-binding protein [Cyanobacteria bacterium SID2]